MKQCIGMLIISIFLGGLSACATDNNTATTNNQTFSIPTTASPYVAEKVNKM